MPDSPDKEWRRLTDLYASMYDEQLLELAADFKDLTEMAQQALRGEMQKRRLPDPTQPNPEAARPNAPHFTPEESESGSDPNAGPEYTWKINLCDCEDSEQATQIREVLRRAGIESWIEASSNYFSSGRGPRLQVAADQLEEARHIVSQPIPQDVIRDLAMAVPEYEPPACPKCGVSDPVLIGVEPTNSWGCEACGYEWADPEEVAGRSEA